MKQQYQVWVSFAGEDNVPLPGEEKGWITDFQHRLARMLSQLFGDTVTFVTGSAATDVSPDQADLFFCMLSPHYVRTEADSGELRHFAEMNTGEQWRIFKIGKQPVSPEKQPESVRSLLVYDFYESAQLTTENHALREDRLYADKEYWLKLADLAYDVHERITQLSGDATLHPIARTRQKAIYLAETGPDLLVQRHIIKRELQRYGFQVLPDQQLPDSAPEIEEAIRKNLASCRLSIHLIGDAYGNIPSGTDQSVVDLQHKFATEHSQTLAETRKSGDNDPAFTRLIWVSPDLKQSDDQQRVFLETIRRNAQAWAGAEIMETSLEDFKALIREELLEADGNHQPSRSIHQTVGQLPVIYFIFDKTDSQSATEFTHLLQKKGFTVEVPTFAGNLLEIRQHHQENLRKFDAAILYKHQASEQWLRAKALELLKAPGLGRGKPALDQVVLTVADVDANYFENLGFTLITNLEAYANQLISHASQLTIRTT